MQHHTETPRIRPLEALAAAMSVMCWVVTLWELRDAALDCEQGFDEDQGDEFGTAA